MHTQAKDIQYMKTQLNSFLENYDQNLDKKQAVNQLIQYLSNYQSSRNSIGMSNVPIQSGLSQIKKQEGSLIGSESSYISKFLQKTPKGQLDELKEHANILSSIIKRLRQSIQQIGQLPVEQRYPMIKLVKKILQDVKQQKQSIPQQEKRFEQHPNVTNGFSDSEGQWNVTLLHLSHLLQKPEQFCIYLAGFSKTNNQSCQVHLLNEVLQ